MVILVDFRPIQGMGPTTERNRLILSAAAGLTGEMTVEWLLLVDHTYQPGDLPDLPGARLVTLHALPGWPGWKLWYDWQIPRLIKKYKPDLVMLTGGVTARPMAVPQCLWMPLSANPKEGPEPPLYASRLRNSLQQAEMIFCFSEKDRTWLAGRGHIAAENILVVRPAPSSTIAPLSIREKEEIKQRYTGGKEYFFTYASTAGEEDVVHLLKAFSLFKKRQMSNLQLVLAGTSTEELRFKLETYKYREDVHWIEPSATRDCMPAAYAVLFPFEDDSLGTTLLDAWKAGVPALVSKDSRLHEIAGEAAIAASATDAVALAGYMMAVYKDEMLRSNLIEKGFSGLTAFDPPSAPAALRTAISRIQPSNTIIK